ncbi:MAG: peptidoglycan DD-metalloendopeptidase family protein [Alphaproteobacteria bacterium]|nr:peptidoglycan DD-metalloendopeptidase family protein [Alphaproteobacteria bacterium]
MLRVEKELAEQKVAARGLEQKQKATEDEIDDLRKKLIAATSEMQRKQSDQEDLAIRLSALEKETALRAAVLAESRNRLAALTSALLELSRVPPELFLLHESSPEEHIHRTILLKSLLPRLQEETNIIAEEITNFEELQKQTSSQKKLLKSAQQNLEWQRHNLDQLVRTRQGFLQKTAGEKAALAKQLENLSSEAQDLRQLMEKVSNPSWSRTVGKGTQGKTPSLKSGLKRPVAGRIIRDYGEKDDFGVASDGVTYLAGAGSPIVAPQSGRVVFAGPFKGYGQIIILQHAGGFHSFLSGFSRIDAETGQNVEAGEPLGVLPSKAEGKPELYFEWRKKNDPIDPTKDGLEKVKG